MYEPNFHHSPLPISIFYCTEGGKIGRCKSAFHIRHEGTLYYCNRQRQHRSNWK